MTHQTRESWLSAAVVHITPWLETAGKPITVPVRIAMGFPSTRPLAATRRGIGECWDPECSADGSAEILISPLLIDPVEILGVVLHELAHAALGHKVGHKGPFKRLVASLGLEGKATATTVGADLAARLAGVLEELGPLPHAALSPRMKEKKKQTTRQLKCACPGCGYLARVARAWLDKGAPICPTCAVALVCQEGQDDGEQEKGDEP
jgi:predicted SprT family Zn-dependent metalloprotease